MEYIAGFLTAVVTVLAGKFLQLDRDRKFYPIILIIIAIIYVLFAIMGKNATVIYAESLFALLFIAIAIIGLKFSGIIIAAGLIGHGMFDLAHDTFVLNTSVPLWWPIYCAVVDILLGMWLFYMASIHTAKQP